MGRAVLIGPALALLLCGGGVAADVPAFGAWGMSDVSGQASVTDETRTRTRSWTFAVDPEDGGNLVRVLGDGTLEFTVIFGGVEGSPHRGGLSLGATGRGEGGEITGHRVQESGAAGEDFHSRVETHVEGTYSDSEMSVSWTYNHVSRAGHITQTTTASGAFTAIHGAAR